MLHLLELFEQGAKDDTWVEQIAKEEPPFVVVTGDRGTKSGRTDPRLPVLLADFGITGIFLSGKLQQRSSFEKVRALMVVWPQIESISQGKRGVRYRLQAHADTYRLTEWKR